MQTYNFGIVYNSGYMVTNDEKTFNKFRKALSKEQKKTAAYYQGKPLSIPDMIAFLQD